MFHQIVWPAALQRREDAMHKWHIVTGTGIPEEHVGKANQWHRHWPLGVGQQPRST